MRAPCFIVLLSIAVVTCKPDAPLTGSERDMIRKEVTKTLHDYLADVHRLGLTAELKYLDHSSDFYWVPPGYASPISYDSVASVLRQSAPMLRSVYNTWDTLRITVHTRSHAGYTGRLHSVIIDSSGNVSENTLIETGFLIRRESGWKLLNGQTSFVK